VIAQEKKQSAYKLGAHLIESDYKRFGRIHRTTGRLDRPHFRGAQSQFAHTFTLLDEGMLASDCSFSTFNKR
jgi:hypothetical protein